MKLFCLILILLLFLVSCNSAESKRIEHYNILFGVRLNPFRDSKGLPLITSEMKVIEDFEGARYIFVDKSRSHRKILGIHENKLIVEEDYYNYKNYELAYRYEYPTSILKIVLFVIDSSFYGGSETKLNAIQADSVLRSWNDK